MNRDINPEHKPWPELAEELLARFSGVDRAELLVTMIGGAYFDLKYGNKREERAACDFLNEVQAEAVKQIEKNKPKPTLAKTT